MKHSFKKLKNAEVELEVSLDQKEFLEYYQPLFDEALSKVALKGFRPGAAPKEMAEKAVDKEKVFEEAVHKAVRTTLKEVSEENSWQLIDQPRVEILESPTGMKYKAHLTVFPAVELGDYQKVAKKVLDAEHKEAPVSDKEVEDSLKWLRQSRAKLTRVNREAKNGDVLDIDFAGFADGKPLDGTEGKADNFVLGEGKFIPGFEEHLIGRKEKDIVEFPITFPKDYWKEDMRNRKVDFKVTVHGVFERELPELNDEFAKSIGKFESAEDLRKNVREGLAKEKQQKEQERVRLKLMEAIIKHVKLDLPGVMVQRTLDSMVQEYKDYAQLSFRGGERQPAEKDEDIRKKLEDKAEKSVATNLIIYQIAKDMQLEPTKEEVEADVNTALSSMRREHAGNLDPQKLYDYSYGVVLNRKVFEFLESLK
ncbi:MAG: trigger factor [Patescibacteria group bacterium]|nr:trigger factor [Patescibacteria group bacterium]